MGREYNNEQRSCRKIALKNYFAAFSLLISLKLVRYNERRKKQAAAKQTFVFYKPLTKVSPAQAGSRVHGAGDLSVNRAQEKTSGAKGGICFYKPFIIYVEVI